MDSTSRAVAELAHKWLYEAGQNETGFLWVDSNELGLDIATYMHRLETGDFTQTTANYDSLPTYIINERNKARLFLLSQPDHFETVLVTMQDALGDLSEFTVENEQSEWAKKLAIDRGYADDRFNPNKVIRIDTNKQRDSYRINFPSIFIVHREDPLWFYIKQFIGSKTNVQITDRVRVQPLLKSNK